jgi:hypothetical protein
LLCLRIITINPALVTSDNPEQEGCIVDGDLMKLLTDTDTLLLLISCQNPLACPITNTNLISKVLNGSTSILMNELLKFGNSVKHYAADGPTCVGHPQWMSDQP